MSPVSPLKKNAWRGPRTTNDDHKVALREPADYPPHERTGLNKIHKRAQSEKEDSIARRIAANLRKRKALWIENVVRQAKHVRSHQEKIGVARDLLPSGLAPLVSDAMEYGKSRVYAERQRATGRPRTERVGRAMLAVAKRGAPAKILENRDINQLGS